ncbi:MAG: hypothetical protein WD872_20290 [Pirellulaceae bacterium]
MNSEQLARALPEAVLSFRGYNVTNLGRSRELLVHPAYGGTVEQHLALMSQAAADELHRPVDLAARVRSEQETSLESYGDAIALIMAMEAAQLDLLERHFGIDYRRAKFSFGYSLGEIAALVAGGVMDGADAVRIPLILSEDCAALAADVTLGVLFTKATALPLEEIRRACLSVNEQGQGVIGISSYLAPNSILILGQGDTLQRFFEIARTKVPERLYLRRNEHRWPPLHTPITWQKNVPNRAAQALHTTKVGAAGPRPNVLSLVTGQFSYTPANTRELLHRWADHPQKLWDAIYATLASGAETLIHVGPAPNLVPATFKRLKENVLGQLAASLSLRAISAVAAQRAWLQRLLPQRAALLRAPYIEQLILEDWLLENEPL